MNTQLILDWIGYATIPFGCFGLVIMIARYIRAVKLGRHGKERHQ